MTRLFLAATIAVTALVLSGCDTVPEPAATPAATSTPTETASAAVRPNALFAIDCAELLTTDEVQNKVTAPISIARDESSVPSEFWDLPLLQRGALSCRWGGENRTGRSFDDGVDLLLLPDAVDDYAARSANGNEQAVEVAGADSAVTLCGFGREPDSAGTPGSCTVFSLVGTTLVELRFSDSQGVYPTEQAIRDVAIGLLEIAIERALAAGPRVQEWVAPTTSIEADAAFCDSVGLSLLAELGVATEFGGSQPLEGYPDVNGCAYYFTATDLSSVNIWLVEGASWAAGVEQTEGPALGQPYEARETGSGVQWWLSPSGEAVQGRAALGGNLVEIVVYWGDIGVTVEQAQAAITAVMEQYAEVAPGS